MTVHSRMAIKHILSALLVFFYLFSFHCFSKSVLNEGEFLFPGDSLENGNWSLVMQQDCNLVLYNNTVHSWSTKTQGLGFECYAFMQKDANFVVYNGRRPLWATNTVRPRLYYFLTLNWNGEIWISDRYFIFYVIYPETAYNGTSTAEGVASKKPRNIR